MKYALSVKQSLLFTDLSLIGCQKEYFKRALNIDYSLSDLLVKADDLYWNYDNDFIFNRAFLKGKALNKSVKNFNISLERATNHLEKISQKIMDDEGWKNQNKTKLISLLQLYLDAYLLNMPFLFHFWNVEHLLISQLKEDFRTIFGGENKEKILQQVLKPAKETYFVKERKSLEGIALFIEKNSRLKKAFRSRQIKKNLIDYPILDKLINKHIEEFAFTSFALQVGKPLTLDVIIERITHLLQDNVLKKFKENQKYQIEEEKIRIRIIEQISDFPDIYERVMLAQEMMFWKNQRLDIIFKSDFKVKPLFDTFASLMRITYEELVYFRYREILKWFKTGKSPTEQAIKKRIENFALYLKSGKISLFTDKNKYPRIEEDSKKETKLSDNEILKGNIAYKGKVKGRVRLVFSAEDIEKVKKGEILVTKMTRPEMIVGLEKATAFVTDQGGMLSHAAIVSREMKKPCIVGTKIATTVLKNGDLIEVDANNGIIRKLD